MNATVVASVLFLAFTMCMGLVAWLITKGISGWGWILFVSILFFGSVSIKHSTIATCPKCGHQFDTTLQNKQVLDIQ